MRAICPPRRSFASSDARCRGQVYAAPCAQKFGQARSKPVSPYRPTCDTNRIQSCEAQALINTYDNIIDCTSGTSHASSMQPVHGRPLCTSPCFTSRTTAKETFTLHGLPATACIKRANARIDARLVLPRNPGPAQGSGPLPPVRDARHVLVQQPVSDALGFLGGAHYLPRESSFATVRANLLGLQANRKCLTL